jgi:hypothetical protein
MAVSIADFAEPERRSYAAELDEQARRKGVHPIASVDDLRADVFESDEELDEFLADLKEFRHQHVARRGGGTDRPRHRCGLAEL